MGFPADAGQLPFSLELVRSLADRRNDFLTGFFQVSTFVGELEGYVAILVLLYVAVDKRLALRLSVLALVAMSLNHFAKTLIANPRPFVAEGSHLERWAVSPEKAQDLATEFSTPSGHAMAGGAVYGFLYANAKAGAVRIACVAVLLLTGLSRPYLGVHFLEDVLIGWAAGLAIAFVALRSAGRIGRRWNGCSYPQQIAIAVTGTLALWIFTRAFGGSGPIGQPTAFVSYAGFLTGIVVGHPLEARHVDFDPRSSTPSSKLLRYGLSMALILGTLLLLDAAFAAVAADASPLGDLLRYVRYAVAGIVGIFAAPLVFLKLGLATSRRAALPA